MTLKIHYITRDPWWDTDRTILPCLTEDYDVVISVQNGTGNLKYRVKERFSSVDYLEQSEKYHYYDPRILFWTKKYCNELEQRSKGCDIVFYCMGGSPFYHIMNYSRLDPAKTVIFIHDLKEHSKNRSFENYLRKRLYRKFRNFAFYSTILRDDFIRQYPDKNVSVIKMPLKTYGPGSKTVSEKRRFLFFGFVRKYKRLDLFIEAAKQVTGNVEFIIAGSGNWNGYTKMIGDNPRFVCHKEFISDGKAADLFSNADFLVLPYDDATQSGPAMTALSYSIPLICSDLPAFKDLVEDGRNGFLFRHGDVDSLSKILSAAAEMDAALYGLMRSEQKKRANEYASQTQISEQFSKLIHDDFGF